MKQRYIRSIQISWIIVIAILLIGMVAPAAASPLAPDYSHSTGALDTNVYLTQQVLRQLFQESINQQVPKITASTLSGILHNTPTADQGWVGQIANALIQPTAILTDLIPQSDGFNTGIKLSLYPGDPKPISTHMLVTMSILNASTIQVSSQPSAGSPALLTGPLTTIQVPMGKLTSVQTATNCGAASLKIGLQIPMDSTAKQGSSKSAPQTGQAIFLATSAQSSATEATLSFISPIKQSQPITAIAPQAAVPATVEVPLHSLSSIATGIDSLPINNSLNAKNIQLGTQKGQLIVTSDIIGLVFGTAMLKVGTATTTIVPQVNNGKLKLHVTKTSLSVLVFNFSVDSYNQQIEQTLNAQIGNAISNSLNLSVAGMGPNAQITCAAPDSLLLTGSTTIN